MKLVDRVLQLSAQDLSNGHGCGHSSALDRRAALGELAKPPRYPDPSRDALLAMGKAHEAAYLAQLRADGLAVAEIDAAAGSGSATAQTTKLMCDGAQAIYQAHLQHEEWIGRADFLLRVDTPSKLGAFSYEVTDTKLGAETRAATILQLCLYSELVSHTQGVMPARMTVVVPGDDFVKEHHRVDDFAAYYRRSRAALLTRLKRDGDSYPEPVEHCDVCHWWSQCDKRWRADDHVSLVAGISRTQRTDLAEHEIRSLRGFAESPPIKPRRGSRQSLERVQKQAQVQLRGRSEGAVLHELILPLEPKRGLNLLPEPNAGDVFLDLEGDAFVGRDGLEYLFGWGRVEDGQWSYRSAWSRNAVEEKSAFDQFMTDVASRRERHPELHIYHYSPYEPSALKRLASRYAVHGDLLDDLLRGERFVDLYRVVRQGVRVSVERYSIKELEPLFGFNRQVDLRDVRAHKRAVESLLQLGHRELPTDSCDVVERYNEDDCRSALALRNWLEGEREKLRTAGEPIERPTLTSTEAKGNVTERLARIQPLEAALLAGLHDDPAARDAQQEARWRMAHMLQWHRRELNCTYWELYRLRDLDAEELQDEPAALVGLRFREEIDKAHYNAKWRSRVYRFEFDPQDSQLRDEDKIRLAGATTSAGEIAKVDHAEGWIDIKAAQALEANNIVAALGVYKCDIVTCEAMEDSLERIADRAVRSQCDASVLDPLAAKLLLRIPSAALKQPFTNAWDIAAHLNGDVLPVQGPPGSGKSYAGARMILALFRLGRKVGVCATSHAVIAHLLLAVREAAQADGSRAPRMIRADSGKGNDVIAVMPPDRARKAFQAGEYDVMGGTPWLWSSEESVSIVDTLFIDEAGQMSLANAVACTPATRNLVLLGDPQQLAQPTKASHPQGTEVSVLEHCLGEQQTISLDRGLFLEDTYRLHPEICTFVSELYYESRLRSAAGREHQRIDGVPGLEGSGLRFEPVEHQGNSNRSDEEVKRVTALFNRLLAGGGQSTNHERQQSALSAADILVVAPYNAQVNALADALPAGARVGTVDKFQGQEAAVVIYSMATSSAQDAPRGMSFLYDPHRLNVAISRARALAIIVASPALLDPTVRSPKQMKLANALARFAELAQRHLCLTPEESCV